jgi:hypothetical protein
MLMRDQLSYTRATLLSAFSTVWKVFNERVKPRPDEKAEDVEKSSLALMSKICENKGRFPINQNRMKSESFESGDAPRGDRGENTSRSWCIVLRIVPDPELMRAQILESVYVRLTRMEQNLDQRKGNMT